MAMAVSFGIKSWIEGGVISAVIFLNITVGFFQEFRAEKTMDSLKSLSSPTATVVRDGQTVTVPTAEIVSWRYGGDEGLVTPFPQTFGMLSAFSLCYATLYSPSKISREKCSNNLISIVEAMNFETDEALLTGESLPVRKDASAVFDTDTGPGDRLNVAYSSSTVTKGRSRGIVFC